MVGLDLMSGYRGIPLSGTMATSRPSCLLLYCLFFGETSKVLAVTPSNIAFFLSVSRAKGEKLSPFFNLT